MTSATGLPPHRAHHSPSERATPIERGPADRPCLFGVEVKSRDVDQPCLQRQDHVLKGAPWPHSFNLSSEIA
jgi:hypothetical protein